MNGTGVNGILLVSDGYLLLQVVTQPFIASKDAVINKFVGKRVEIIKQPNRAPGYTTVYFWNGHVSQRMQGELQLNMQHFEPS